MRKGKESAYGKHEQTLDELDSALVRLADDISTIKDEEKRVRSADQMCTTLLEYTHILREVISNLSIICQKLGTGEKAYRKDSGESLSPYTQDKTRYDQSRQRLQRVGSQITKLFSTY